MALRERTNEFSNYDNGRGQEAVLPGATLVIRICCVPRVAGIMVQWPASRQD